MFWEYVEFDEKIDTSRLSVKYEYASVISCNVLPGACFSNVKVLIRVRHVGIFSER